MLLIGSGIQLNECAALSVLDKEVERFARLHRADEGVGDQRAATSGRRDGLRRDNFAFRIGAGDGRIEAVPEDRGASKCKRLVDAAYAAYSAWGAGIRLPKLISTAFAGLAPATSATAASAPHTKRTFHLCILLPHFAR